VKPTALGFGGMVGPLLVKYYGYKVAFFLSSFVCTLTLVFIFLELLYTTMLFKSTNMVRLFMLQVVVFGVYL
jgi:hypothetical protein